MQDKCKSECEIVDNYNKNETYILCNSDTDSTISDNSVDINDIIKRKVKLYDDDGYEVYENKSTRKKRLIKEYANLLKGAPPPIIRLFVSRVSFGSENTIDNYLRRCGVKPLSVVVASKPNAKYSSYKVSVYKTNVDAVLQDNFWPAGIKCRLWRELKGTRGRIYRPLTHENRRYETAKDSSNPILRSRVFDSSKHKSNYPIMYKNGLNNSEWSNFD